MSRGTGVSPVNSCEDAWARRPCHVFQQTVTNSAAPPAPVGQPLEFANGVPITAVSQTLECQSIDIVGDEPHRPITEGHMDTARVLTPRGNDAEAPVVGTPRTAVTTGGWPAPVRCRRGVKCRLSGCVPGPHRSVVGFEARGAVLGDGPDGVEFCGRRKIAIDDGGERAVPRIENVKRV